MKKKPIPKQRPTPEVDGSLFGGSQYPCFVAGCKHIVKVRPDGGRPWFCVEHEAQIKAADKQRQEQKKRPWRKWRKR